MSSNYAGVDSFLSTLSLMTDGDKPFAATFRLPLERLLDNDIHLRGLVNAVQTAPEAYAEIRDDFIGCWFDTANNVLHSALPWEVTSIEDAVPATNAADGHPGIVSANLATGEAFELELAGSQNNIRWGDLQDATFIARLTSSDFTDAEFFVGMAENFDPGAVGNSAVGLWFDHGTSATQWLVRHKVGGVDDATLSGMFIGSGVWVTMKIHRISSTQVEIYLFGDLVATLTDGVDAPGDSAQMTVGTFATAGSVAAMTPDVDLVYVRWTTAAARTP